MNPRSGGTESAAMEPEQYGLQNTEGASGNARLLDFKSWGPCSGFFLPLPVTRALLGGMNFSPWMDSEER